MFTKRKLKQRIQFLEAQVRGLSDENQKLQVSANDARLQVESLRKAIEMYQSKLPIRNAKGQFVKK
ncbi:hypothetical protein SDC9_121723 [bioreactor metagenome]|uniref:Uncharacterized protein n=1 Tax=bioreactor metagenome TaxID=1076179 RepID=A0A645CCT0_9ZZZZ|nr:hypothetical protein [Petrimonas sp.]